MITLYSSKSYIKSWGSGQIVGRSGPPLPPVVAPMHETLFDELKASEYRRKKERSVAFKIRKNAPPRTPVGYGVGHDAHEPPSRLGRGPPCHTHLAPSAPRFSRLQLPVWEIYLSLTNHPDQLSLAIHPWVAQWVPIKGRWCSVTGVKTDMVLFAGKTVWSISERVKGVCVDAYPIHVYFT